MWGNNKIYHYGWGRWQGGFGEVKKKRDSNGCSPPCTLLPSARRQPEWTKRDSYSIFPKLNLICGRLPPTLTVARERLSRHLLDSTIAHPQALAYIMEARWRWGVKENKTQQKSIIIFFWQSERQQPLLIRSSKSCNSFWFPKTRMRSIWHKEAGNLISSTAH